MSKWGKVQFYHHPEGFRGSRYSVAVEVPDSHEFLRMVLDLHNGRNPELTSIRVGHTVVSPKDTFSKKVGRDLSAFRLEPRIFKVNSVRFIKPGKVEIYLSTLNNEFSLVIHTLTHEKCTPYLVDAFGVRGTRE